MAVRTAQMIVVSDAFKDRRPRHKCYIQIRVWQTPKWAQWRNTTTTLPSFKRNRRKYALMNVQNPYEILILYSDRAR
jgi:hypothetical protein